MSELPDQNQLKLGGGGGYRDEGFRFGGFRYEGP